MTRLHWVPFALLVSVNPACGGDSSDAGAETKTGGAGGAGADGTRGGTGGFGADSCGGDAGGWQCDRAYACPASPYVEPSAAVVVGNFPSMLSAHRMGRDETDWFASMAPLPDGGYATILLRGTYDAMSFALTRNGADQTVVPLFSWPGTRENNAFVRADAQGNLVVAGVASSAFTIGDTSIDYVPSEVTTGGFIYLVRIDQENTINWSKTFEYQGHVRLEAAGVSPAGEIALAGQVSGELTLDSGTLASPVYSDTALQSAFTLRLDPDGALVSSSLFHATGTHNDPPPLDGAGGTEGYGQSSITDVAFWPDGALVVTAAFRGGIVVGDERLPNDGVQDALIVTLDEASEPVWIRHVHGRMGEIIPNTGGSGGISGSIPDGVVGALGVGVGDDGKVTVTGPLSGRAVLENTNVENGDFGDFTAVFDRDGALVGANSGGGTKVVRLGSQGSVIWDYGNLVHVDDQGTVLSSLAFGGEFLSVPAELARGDNLLFATSFVGRLDLGSEKLDSAGCADTFVASFGLPPVE